MLFLVTGSVRAQQSHDGPHETDAAAQRPAPDAPAVQAWRWHVDANVFFGLNYQRRKFRDFSAWESQNWLMLGGQRPVGRGRLTVSSMLSLEALTLRDIGSPQVFQTGETFRGAPLIDYQHPHDLLMGLGAEYTGAAGPITFSAGADLVGTPSLGPTPFMHRTTARDNPQAPLSHHHLDSTHVTPGVLRAGIAAGDFRLDGSLFHGREPDENRLDVDPGALDSYATRLSWTRQGWSAQVSGAKLELPERTTPYDATRLTASIGYAPPDSRGIAWFGAFGQNREIHGNLEAYLLEATFAASGASRVYARIESVAKDILDAGFHPPGTFHRHRQSQVGALTIGYLRDVMTTPAGTYAAGADISVYAVPRNLSEAYGAPVSVHLFVRYRPPPRGMPAHVH
jgi:hypothetical protein